MDPPRGLDRARTSRLQTASITAGLPVAVILLFCCTNLARALRREHRVKGVESP
jgi:choline/glycine/proline betaine transport protein